MSDIFQKKFGFDRPPVAFFSGTWQAFKHGIEADLTCKTCGGRIHIFFRGNPDTMNEAGIKRWILFRAEKRHECPAVADIINSGRKKYFADIYRGLEKKHEEDRHLIKGDFSGKPTGNA